MLILVSFILYDTNIQRSSSTSEKDLLRGILPLEVSIKIVNKMHFCNGPFSAMEVYMPLA